MSNVRTYYYLSEEGEQHVGPGAISTQTDKIYILVRELMLLPESSDSRRNGKNCYSNYSVAVEGVESEFS